jgi:hypothetical protein
MFWRGNVERTCRKSLLNNAQELLSLKEKCSAKAAGGGNPDACTACVEIAELHVPNLNFGGAYLPVGDSKCSALGVTARGQVPGGLPAWWYDNYYRYVGIHEGEVTSDFVQGLDHPGFDVALTWCTGAEIRRSIGGALPFQDDTTYVVSASGWLPARDSELSYEPKSGPTCTDELGNQYGADYGISHRRHGQAFIEEYNQTTPNWVYPLVTALDYTSEVVPVGECGGKYVDSRAARFLDAAGDPTTTMYAPQSQISHIHGGASGISAPRCGVRQRMYFWNRPCSIATENWNFRFPATFNFFSAQDGTEIDEIAYGNDVNPDNNFCLLREPRTLVTSCPNGMTCSASGECNADDQSASVNLISAP